MNSPRLTLRKRTVFFHLLLVLLVLLPVLPGCGGGGGATVAGGGTGGTGLTTGAATNFGSVFIGDLKFVTDNTTIRRRVDDNVVSTEGPDEGFFLRGMVLRVRHTGDNAVEIDFHNDLEGPVSGLTGIAPNFRFSILGQLVLTDNATNIVLENGALPFAEGSVVEVSGLYDNSAILRATFIEVEKADDPPKPFPFEIKGFVSNLDNVLRRFTMGPRPGAGTIAVDYSTAVLDDPPAGLDNGLFVEVKTSTAPPAGEPIVAAFVEREESVADEAATAASVSIEGFIADLTPGPGPQDFIFLLDGLTVRTSAATTGVDLVGPNAHVQVEGTMANGILSAGAISRRE